MDRAEFDKFADTYRALHHSNINASGETPEYFADYKMRDLKRLADRDRRGDEHLHVLDFGAGIGVSVPFFQKYFPSAYLTCVDLSVKSLEIARARIDMSAAVVAFDGVDLPFPDMTFDYVFAACVFHHIAIEQHRRIFAELRRVLKPAGQVMIYEHNPLNPITVAAVNTCPFDENARLVKAPAMRARLESVGFRESRVRYRVFFPRMLWWLRWLEGGLGWLPLGAQYCATGRR